MVVSAPADIEGQNGCRRSGCLLGWLTGALVRLVLVYPPAVMGSALGQHLQGLLLSQAGTAYEGALGGATLGGLAGVILAWRGLIPGGRRAGVADAALCWCSALWLLAIAAQLTTGIGETETIIIWAAGLLVPLIVAGLG